MVLESKVQRQVCPDGEVKNKVWTRYRILIKIPMNYLGTPVGRTEIGLFVTDSPSRIEIGGGNHISSLGNRPN